MARNGEFRPTHSTAFSSLMCRSLPQPWTFGRFEPGEVCQMLSVESVHLNREGHTPPTESYV
jgi:hypothetical protein